MKKREKAKFQRYLYFFFYLKFFFLQFPIWYEQLFFSNASHKYDDHFFKVPIKEFHAFGVKRPEKFSFLLFSRFSFSFHFIVSQELLFFFLYLPHRKNIRMVLSKSNQGEFISNIFVGIFIHSSYCRQGN